MNWKLKELCLRRVIEQFDRYVALYTSKDVKLNRLFDFLLRVYSQEIISELYFRNQLDFKYADILINKYLTSINTDWFRTTCWKTISAKMAAIGFGLEKLCVHEDTRDMPWKDVFCYLPNLEVVNFGEDSCSIEILECIADFCPNIVEMRIEGSEPFEGVRHLYERKKGGIPCPKLRKLYVDCINREDTEYILENFPCLEHAELEHLPFVLYDRHKEDVLKTGKTVSYNLTCLSISNISDSLSLVEYDHLLVVCFSVCPHLNELVCSVYCDEHLQTLCSFKNLTKLDIHCPKSPALDLNELLKCIGSTLKSLRMWSCTASVSVLAESCPLLEALETVYVYFQADDEAIVPALHHLSSCIFHTILPESIRQVCALLAASYRLTNLTFQDCFFLSEMGRELVKAFSHSSLKVIHIYDGYIKYEFPKQILVSCPSLSELYFTECVEEGDPELKEISDLALTLPMKPLVHFN